MSTSKNGLSSFPLFICLKPSRLSRIPVGVLFRRNANHFGNDWQSESCPLVPTHTRQEVKDPTEKTHLSPPRTLGHWYREIFRIWAARGYLDFLFFLSTQLTCVKSLSSILLFILTNIQRKTSKLCHCSKQFFFFFSSQCPLRSLFSWAWRQISVTSSAVLWDFPVPWHRVTPIRRLRIWQAIGPNAVTDKKEKKLSRCASLCLIL